MGRWIDGGFLRGGAAALGFFLSLSAWGSVPAACAAALACAALAGLALGERKAHGRQGPLRGRAALQALAAMDEAQAAAVLAPLLERRWPGEACHLALLLKHPSASAGANDILGLWKANRDATRLLIAATCAVDAGALAFARGLTGPAVAVLDDRALLRLLRNAPLEPPRRHPGERLRALGAALARPAPPRYAGLCLLMLWMYVRLGHPLYLLGGLWLALRLGMRLASGRPRRRLFADGAQEPP